MQSRIRTGLAGACLLALLTACGGGGSSAPPPPAPRVTIGGTILGLATDASLTLTLNGGAQTFESAGDSTSFRFSADLVEGRSYTVVVAAHPVNQLCAVSAGAGTASSSVSSVLVSCHATVLNDTGVPEGDEGATGRDAAAQDGTLSRIGGGRLGFDFTRVCGSGEAAGEGGCPATPVAGSGDDAWVCTRDNVTNLLWQSQPPDSLVVRDDAAAVAAAAADAALCGRDDWRLPAVIELTALVDNGAAAGEPSIDTDFFPGTVQDAYWTGESRAGDAATSWVVSFDSGAVAVLNVGGEAAVRPVAGTGPTAAIDAVSGSVVTSNGLQLMWLASGETADQAGAAGVATAARAAVRGGFDDWRVPNRNELAALVDRSTSGPAVDSAAAGVVTATGHWSTTPFRTAADVSDPFGWVVDFGSGDVLPRPAIDVRSVILVRNIVPGEE